MLKFYNRLPDIGADIEYQPDWFLRELATVVGGKTNAMRQPTETADCCFYKLFKQRGLQPYCYVTMMACDVSVIIV